MLTHTVYQGHSFRHTCVVLCFQVQVVQFVNVADVHLLFVQLSFVEVLTGAVGGSVMNEWEQKESWDRGGGGGQGGIMKIIERVGDANEDRF